MKCLSYHVCRHKSYNIHSRYHAFDRISIYLLIKENRAVLRPHQFNTENIIILNIKWQKKILILLNIFNFLIIVI